REAPPEPLPPELELDPELAAGLRVLSGEYREALLLIAWDDLTPAQAARSLGISRTAFRARLHRARRQLQNELATQPHVRRRSAAAPWRCRGRWCGPCRRRIGRQQAARGRRDCRAEAT